MGWLALAFGAAAFVGWFWRRLRSSEGSASGLPWASICGLVAVLFCGLGAVQPRTPHTGWAEMGVIDVTAPVDLQRDRAMTALRAAWGVAGLTAGSRTDDLVVRLSVDAAPSGSVLTGAPAPPVRGRNATVQLPGPPLPFDPRDLEVRGRSTLRQDRPATIQLVDGSLLDPASVGEDGALESGLMAQLDATRSWSLTVRRVSDETNAEAAIEPLESEPMELAGGGLSRPRFGGIASREAIRGIAWTPTADGAHAIHLDVELRDGRAFRASGRIDVQSPPLVRVVGAGGEGIAAALTAQGLRVEQAEADAEPPPIPAPSPRDDDAPQVVVVTERLPANHEEAWRAFVNGGGGVLFVGHGVPRTGEPLAALSAVTLPERRDRTGGEAMDPNALGSETGEDGTGDNAPPSGEASSPTSDPDMAEPNAPATVDPKNVVADQDPSTGTPGSSDAPVGALDKGADPDADPVLDPTSGPVIRRSVAMVIAIDRSGSMGERASGSRTRMDFAKESALRTAESLQAGDQVGVVLFDIQGPGGGQVALELTDATALDVIRPKIEAIYARRADTYVIPGLVRSAKMFEGVDFAVKHIVVITDAGFNSESAAELELRTRRIAAQGITVSVIQIEPAMQGVDLAVLRARVIAKAGGGRNIVADSAANVPVLVTREVAWALNKVGRATAPGTGGGVAQFDPGAGTSGGGDESANDPGSSAAEDEPRQPDVEAPDSTVEDPANPDAATDTPKPEDAEPSNPTDSNPGEDVEPLVTDWLPVYAVRPDAPLLAPPPEVSYPQLGSVPDGVSRRDARTLLVAGNRGVPVLAFANRGLGRVACFTAPLDGPGAQRLIAAPSWPAWLSAWVTDLMPPLRTVARESLLGDPEFRTRSDAGATPAMVARLAAWSGKELRTERSESARGLQPVGGFGIAAKATLRTAVDRVKTPASRSMAPWFGLAALLALLFGALLARVLVRP